MVEGSMRPADGKAESPVRTDGERAMSPPTRCRAIALQPRCGGVERGNASVAGGKKVCAVRRIRACATRNRMPFRNFFLARVQAAGMVVSEVARRSRRPRDIIGALDLDE